MTCWIPLSANPGPTAKWNSCLNPYAAAAAGWFGQYKRCKKNWKRTETLALGYSFESTPWELSNEHQHDRVKMVFKNLCVALEGSTLPMLRLFSSKAQQSKDFWNLFKPCHVGIHWIVLVECSRVSTHVVEFQCVLFVFFSFFLSFCISQISH